MDTSIITKLLPGAIAAIFAMATLFFIVTSVILNYHWGKYVVRGERLKNMRVIYFSVSAIIFVLIGIFAAGALRLI